MYFFPFVIVNEMFLHSFQTMFRSAWLFLLLLRPPSSDSLQTYEFGLIENFVRTKSTFLSEQKLAGELLSTKSELQNLLLHLKERKSEEIESSLHNLNELKVKLAAFDANFPEFEDWKGAATAMLVLKDFYQLDLRELISGALKSSTLSFPQSPSRLDIWDFTQMAQVAMERKWFDLSADFLKEAIDAVRKLSLE